MKFAQPKQRVSTVSVIPENATLIGRYVFTLIGPETDKVVTSIQEAELYQEMSDMMEKGNDQDANDGQDFFGVASTSLSHSASLGPRSSTGSECKRKMDLKSMFAMIDEDEIQVAKIYMTVISGFSSSMRKLADEEAVRNACFLFFVDTRLDLQQDIMTIFNQAFAEMNFMHSDLAKKAKSGKMPPLRAVLLTHRQGATGEFVLPMDEEGEVQALSTRIGDISKNCGLRKHHVAVDFDDCDSLFMCLQEVAKDMHKANQTKGVFNRMFNATSTNGLTMERAMSMRSGCRHRCKKMCQNCSIL